MIKAKIKGQGLVIDQPIVAAGTIAYLEIQFDFSEEWDGFIKTAHFLSNDEDVVYDVLIENDKISADKQLNLSEGTWFVWIHGNEYESGKMITRITTDIAKIKVKQTGKLDGEPIKITPPSIGEQILGIATEAKNTAEAAKETAESVAEFPKDLLYEKTKSKGKSITIPQYALKNAKVIQIESEAIINNNHLLTSGFAIKSNDVTYSIPEQVTSLPNYGYGAGGGYNNTVDFENGKYIQRCNVFEPANTDSHGEYTYFQGLTFDFPISRYDECVRAIETIKCSHSELTFSYHEVTKFEEDTISSGMLNVKFNGAYISSEDLEEFIGRQRANNQPVVVCYGLFDPIVTAIPKVDIEIPVKPCGGVDFYGAVGTLEMSLPKDLASKKYVKSTFANALRGQLFGASVRADDVSPVEHELDIKITGENVEGTKVKRLGKNFANLAGLDDGKKYKAVTDIASGYRIDEENNIIITTCPTEHVSNVYVGTDIKLSELCPEAREGMTLRLSAIDSYSEGASKGNVIIYLSQAATAWAFTAAAKAITITQQMLDSNIVFYASPTPNAVRTISNFQIELGDTATEYEPYRDSVEAIAGAEGDVKGLMSLSPNMTLTTDNGGAVIECGYNKDTNKVIENLTNAIISLGGNI